MGWQRWAEEDEVSSSSSDSSEEEASSDEEEEDTAAAAQQAANEEALKAAQAAQATQAAAAQAAAAQTQRGYDPMQQLLGIPAYQSQAQASHAGVAPQMRAQAFNNTDSQRIAAVKAGMQRGGQQGMNQGGMDHVYQAQMRARQQQQQQAQLMQNMYNTQQQQQQMAYQSYNPAAAYQTGAYNNMQMVAVDPNMQGGMGGGYMGMGGGMMGGGMGGGGMGGGAGAMVPYQNPAAALIPAMEAEKATKQASDYRVRRGTKPSRVNASDQAFGPLLDQMMNK